MIIMVTGSSGTVGTALVQKLTACKIKTIPIDIRGNLFDKRLNNRTIRYDLRKPLTSLKLKQLPDMIVHLAANARVHDLVVRPELALHNYLMTHNVMEFARTKGIQRLIFSSSREVYGESALGEKRKEQSVDVTTIKSPYTASKLGSESLIHAYEECYDLKSVIIRLSNVYGRYDASERVIPLFIYYAMRNRDIPIFGAEKKLDFTYTDDCIDGIYRVIRRHNRVAGETFNISRGRGERLINLAKMIVKQAGSSSIITTSNKRVGEISSYIGDNSKAKRLLGYKPKVNLKEGLSKNIEWYQKAIKNDAIYRSQRRNLSKRGWA